MEFLDVYRDDEYIRQHTKGMSLEKTRKFALAYYGWDDDPDLEIDESKNTWDGFLDMDPDAVPFA